MYKKIIFTAIAALAMVSTGFIFYRLGVMQNKCCPNLDEAYKRFVPTKFVQLLKKKTIDKIDLGDQTLQAMTVMFFDVVDFTALSEKLSTKETISFMNNIFATLQPIIAKHNGILNKFLGDGAMVLFPSSEDDAVAAAIEMTQAMEKTEGSIGIGIDSGPLMAGTVGIKNRMEFTVYGNTVNLASRVEKLTRTYGTNILITEQVYSRLNNKSALCARIIDTVEIKGKHAATPIYGLFANQKTCKSYNEGFDFYRHGEYKKAVRAFEKVLKVDEEDTVAKFHLNRCRRHMSFL